MKDRRAVRLKKFFLAKVALVSGDIIAYTRDLSINGACFSCNQQISVGENIVLQLSAPGLTNMRLKGFIVWKRDLPTGFKTKFQYGVALREITRQYKEFIDKALERNQDRERRKNTRYGDALVIQNEDVLDLLGAGTLNISADGLYIRTNTKLRQGNRYELRLVGPQLDKPIECSGVVVNVFDAPDDDEDAFFGAGLRLETFKGDCRERFEQYIKGLEKLYRFHWPPELVIPEREEES